MISVDYIVVGAGLTGATIARTLADAGREVVVLERRDRIGGNVADEMHYPSGIRMNLYGPHYFRTDSDRIWDWVRRFADFYPYEARIMSWIDGRYEHWPIQQEYIDRTVPMGWYTEITNPTNFELGCLQKMPMDVYAKAVVGYTEKQWGVPAHTLDADLARRVEVRTDGDTRLKKCKHQGIPRGGYSAWVERMLQGIEVRLGADYLKKLGGIFYPVAKKCLIFTGPIDEFFNFELGRLKYRGQQREHHEWAVSAEATVHPVGQVNYPGLDHLQVRVLEWKHMMEEPYKHKGTVLTWETPFTPTDPDQYEYPFPSQEQQRLFLQYKKRADAIPGLLICGRLGDYRYYDMDQAIARGLQLAGRILECSHGRG